MPQALAPSSVEQVRVSEEGGILALGASTGLGLPRLSRVAGVQRLGFVAPMTVAGPRRIYTGFPPFDRRVTDSLAALSRLAEVRQVGTLRRLTAPRRFDAFRSPADESRQPVVLRLWKVSKVSALMLAACSSPAPAELSRSLVSEQGLVDVDVRIAAPVRRGDNDLFVEVRPHAGEGEAELLGVRATMAAHGHEAPAATLEQDGDGYHAFGLDLFMSGRWQLELELRLDQRPDGVGFPIDVP